MQPTPRGHPAYWQNSGEMLKVPLEPTIELSPSRDYFEVPISVNRRTAQRSELPVLPLYTELEETINVPSAAKNRVEEVRREEAPLVLPAGAQWVPLRGLVFESRGAEQYEFKPDGDEEPLSPVSIEPAVTTEGPTPLVLPAGTQWVPLRGLVFEPKGAEEFESNSENDEAPLSPIQHELNPAVPISVTEPDFVSRGEEPESPEKSGHELLTEKEASLPDLFKKFLEEACMAAGNVELEETVVPTEDQKPTTDDDNWSDLSAKSEERIEPAVVGHKDNQETVEIEAKEDHVEKDLAEPITDEVNAEKPDPTESEVSTKPTEVAEPFDVDPEAPVEETRGLLSLPKIASEDGQRNIDAPIDVEKVAVEPSTVHLLNPLDFFSNKEEEKYVLSDEEQKLIEENDKFFDRLEKLHSQKPLDPLPTVSNEVVLPEEVGQDFVEDSLLLDEDDEEEYNALRKGNQEQNEVPETF
uniref:TPR_REGION domain-containing protein n=1 Tax=Caenorhabditis tropicalis TaxID=1561998 RepID=A0A1I7TQL2_9PELO